MGWKFYNSSGQLLTAPASTASADLATEATNVTVTQNDSESADLYPVFVDGLSSTQGIETDAGFTYNPSSGLLVIAGELDAGSLDISGNADIDGTMEADVITVNGSSLASVIAGTTVTNATNATNITVADTTDATCFVALWESVTGAQAPKSDAGITYNASSGMLTATGLTGPLTGTATGLSGSVLTGDVTTSSNAATLVLSNLTGAAINVANDSIPFLDSDGSATRIESIADLATAMAGTNLTASSGQLVAGAAGAGLGLVIALS